MKNRSPCFGENRQTIKSIRSFMKSNFYGNFSKQDVRWHVGAMVVSSSSPLVNIMVE